MIKVKLFEYEAKEIYKLHGIKVPKGVVIAKSDDIEKKIEESKLKFPLVVKSQVLVAGRGKSGGVKFAKDINEAVTVSNNLFNLEIKGLKPNFLLIEEAVEHDNEYFASITIDRAERCPVILVSKSGGMEIEEVSKKSPESIIKYHVDPILGMRDFEARNIGYKLGLSGKELASFTSFLKSLYNIFEMYDGDLVESNPFTIVNGEVIALDSRIIIDDNSVYKHKELVANKEMSGEETEWEIRAKQRGFAFVELDGNIGIIGNGAGLTMATMDLIYEFGGSPANFLDIGGGANSERVKEAVSLLLEYPKAKSIFINIFGGITRCDEVARGIEGALKSVGKIKPIFVRLSGTNEEEGKRILKELGISSYNDPIEAARSTVNSVKGGE
ncbi:Succinyl-CoA synthetase beta chain [Fervidicoccus fontis Kam940]|uniref:Succinate--CoA ligase [ADP-forming] subunit beta n=1 Tax=Fervidicoccus fontis (strain DSM 19380 / JCM 18336 / VKM B-2539 / Kam940) TaxID=1163730 RepID=I0A048_FERFK|nr:Succinyl-CoA synthetase beta chain [Fervidicoccus fontis Kam940]